MIAKIIKKTKYTHCPICENEWVRELNRNPYCKNCNSEIYSSEYILSRTLGPYQLEWFDLDGTCRISKHFSINPESTGFSYKFKKTILEIKIPYNITEEKLKTYLLFM